MWVSLFDTRALYNPESTRPALNNTQRSKENANYLCPQKYSPPELLAYISPLFCDAIYGNKVITCFSCNTYDKHVLFTLSYFKEKGPYCQPAFLLTHSPESTRLPLFCFLCSTKTTSIANWHTSVLLHNVLYCMWPNSCITWGISTNVYERTCCFDSD